MTINLIHSPLTSTSPANEYWGVDISVVYGKSHAIFSDTAGIVDTGTHSVLLGRSLYLLTVRLGTTLILFASDYYKKYKSDTGGTDDSTTGLIKFTPSQYSKLPSLFVTFGGVRFSILSL